MASFLMEEIMNTNQKLSYFGRHLYTAAEPVNEKAEGKEDKENEKGIAEGTEDPEEDLS